jgi:hypothetical protein
MELHSTRLQLTGRRLPPVETLSTRIFRFRFCAARDELTFVLNEAFIGNPTTFGWLSATALRKSHFGSNGLQTVDIAPDDFTP